MIDKKLELAAKFLEQLSEKMSNAGCNDWEWPEDWSQSERDKFAEEYFDVLGDGEEFEPDMYLPDFCAVDLLVVVLRNRANKLV